MKRLALLCAACTLVLAVGCEATTSNQNEKESSEVKYLGELNVDDPSGFLQRNFSEKPSTRPGGDSLKVNAIDAPSTVVLTRGGAEVVLRCELVAASQAGGLVSISCNSRPLNLEESIAIAKGVCAVSGMDQQKILDWHQALGNPDANDLTCFVSGDLDGKYSSVEIRRSFEPSLPWRVLYEISYGGIADSAGEGSGK